MLLEGKAITLQFYHFEVNLWKGQRMSGFHREEKNKNEKQAHFGYKIAKVDQGWRIMTRKSRKWYLHVLKRVQVR